MKLCKTLFRKFPACSVGVIDADIGGADGPTAVYVTSRPSRLAIIAGGVAAAAFVAAVVAGVAVKSRGRQRR